MAILEASVSVVVDFVVVDIVVVVDDVIVLALFVFTDHIIYSWGQ